MKRAAVLIVAALAVAAGAPRARAQGILQNTFDRGSWPTEEERRTIVIPEQMFEVQVEAGLASVKAIDINGSGDTATDYLIAPTVAYGVNRNVTIGAAQYTSITPTVTFDQTTMTTIEGTDVRVGRGDVFAIARPFNDYDIGVRVDVPFVPDSPTIVDLEPHLVGHVSLSLDRSALFFDAGALFNVLADDNAVTTTQEFGRFDLLFQLNPLLALSAGGGYTHVKFHDDQMGFGGADDVFDLHGKALYALGNGVDLYGILGATLNDESSKYLTAGVAVWR